MKTNVYDENKTLLDRIAAKERALKAPKNSLSFEEKKRLTDAGEFAEERLLQLNEGLIYDVIRRCRFFSTGAAADNEDILRSGQWGLIQAARHYDPDRGAFTTLAELYIRREINRGLNPLRYPLSIPEEKQMKLSSIRRLQADGYTDDEICAAVSLKRDEYDKLLRLASPAQSLQDPVGDEENDLEFGDVIADPAAESVDDICSRIALAGFVQESFRFLKENGYTAVYIRMMTGMPLRELVERHYVSSIGAYQKQEKRALTALRSLAAHADLPLGA